MLFLNKTRLPISIENNDTLNEIIEKCFEKQSTDTIDFKELMVLIVYSKNKNYLDSFVKLVPEKLKKQVYERGILVAALEDNVDFFNHLAVLIEEFPINKQFWEFLWLGITKNNSTAIVEVLCADKKHKNYLFSIKNYPSLGVKVLQNAVKFNHLEVLKVLVKSTNDTNMTDEAGEISAPPEDVLSVMQILDFELRKQEAGEQGLDLETLLAFILFTENQDLLNRFSSAVSEEKKKKTYASRLIAAAAQDNLELFIRIKDLLEELPKKNRFWSDLWLQVAQDNSKKVAKFLCENETYRKSLFESEGNSPSFGAKALFKAVELNHLEVLEILVGAMEKSKNFNNVLKKFKGKAEENGFFEISLFIEGKIIDIEEKEIDDELEILETVGSENN